MRPGSTRSRTLVARERRIRKCQAAGAPDAVREQPECHRPDDEARAEIYLVYQAALPEVAEQHGAHRRHQYLRLGRAEGKGARALAPVDANYRLGAGHFQGACSRGRRRTVWVGRPEWG